MEKYIFITYIFIIGTVFGSFFNVCIFRIPNKESISNPQSYCYKCNNRLTYLDLIPILSWILLVFGSFFNVCIFRIPNKESISNPQSYCYKCNNRLTYLDLIPILSWILLKGKCRHCGQKISSRYPLIELLTGILFIIIYNVHGLNFITINYLVLTSLLIIITFIDIDYYIIPDSMIILGILFIIIYNVHGLNFITINYLVLTSLLIIITFIDIDYYIIPDSMIILGSIFELLFNLTNKGISIRNSIIGGVVCSGVMLILITLIDLVVKKEVMGGGDIKLFFMIGLFLGLKLGLLTILLSIYVGAFYGIVTIIYSKIKKQEYNSIIPYGPFISVGAIISVLCGTNIINWYIDLFI